MELNEYQQLAKKTAIYPKDQAISYTILGLASEAGEVAGKYKKILRDKDSQLTEKDIQELKKELGDILWYIASLSSELGVTLEDVASTNISKLLDRQRRNKIKGNGDER